jgi:uncharacterized protein YqjF (DUF2071 family)
MLNYEIDAASLRSLVPRGCQLENWQGHTFVSLVGFAFLDTRVLGFGIPLHRDFPEVNLRFYVRREVGEEVRRGVVFVKEMVPRAAIALTARTLFNEPYSAVPMRWSTPPAFDAGGTATYEWRQAGRWERVEILAEEAPYLAEPGSADAFLTEQFWGYTARPGRATLEYRVEHPKWRLRKAQRAILEANVAALYGPQFAAPLSAPPWSAFLAGGSAVCVFPPQPISGS